MTVARAQTPDSDYLLTGDIGGTNSRMSLYAVAKQPEEQRPLLVIHYKNNEVLPPAVRSNPNAFADNVIVPFLRECWGREVFHPAGKVIACFATAGVVTNNRVNLTNLDNLLIDGDAIMTRARQAAASFEESSHRPSEPPADDIPWYLGTIISCTIINDFVAQGYGCLTLKSHECLHLYGPPLDFFQNDAQPDGHGENHIPSSSSSSSSAGPKVCVGAGTGLGECYLTPTPTTSTPVAYTCFPSEGGHVEFAPRNELEFALCQYLQKRYDSPQRVSVERIVSGLGLVNCYEFLTEYYPEQIDETVHSAITANPDDAARIIAQQAKQDLQNAELASPSLCQQAMSLMMCAYGCEVGSAALKWIPTGGLFITGGIAPKNMEYMKGADSDFIQSYQKKGRVSGVLKLIPLYLATVEDLGIRGAYQAAWMEYERLVSIAPMRTSTTISAGPSKITWNLQTWLSNKKTTNAGITEWWFPMTMTAAVGAVAVGMMYLRKRE